MPPPSPAVSAGDAPSDPKALEVLLGLLSAPLCQRSASMLEQLLLLVEVVLQAAQRQAHAKVLAQVGMVHCKSWW